MLNSVNLIAAIVAVSSCSGADHVSNADAMPRVANGANSSVNSGNLVFALSHFEQQIAFIRSTHDGWAGSGSAAVPNHLLSVALNAVGTAQQLAPHRQLPAILPCSDGSVQIEWHEVDGAFEMYFEIDGTIQAWAVDRETGQEYDVEGAAAFNLMTDWITRSRSWAADTIAA